LEYFEQIGYICPLDANPADFVLKLMTNYEKLSFEERMVRKSLISSKSKEFKMLEVK
jgi:hypothetical protein